MTDIGIVGASGYGGGELIRLLSRHPGVRMRTLASETYTGQPLSAAFPSLAGISDLTFSHPDDFASLSKCEVVFFAAENGVAMCKAKALLEAGCKVIDLGADFRFRSAIDYEVWYGTPHASTELTKSAIYGLPELSSAAAKSARLIANPGCYATASLLALAPLVSEGAIELDSIVIDGKSGVSGAGRSKSDLGFRFSEANENVSAYKAGGTHRHTGEIEQELSALAKTPVLVSFTPHLVPMTRGILASCYATASSSTSGEDLKSLFQTFYADSPFVAVVEKPPATKHTLGSNMAHISLAFDKRTKRVSVFAAIDNLGKGMAGQAIQNMNLMLGFDEKAGLEAMPLWP